MKVLITGSRNWTKRGPIQVLLSGIAGWDEGKVEFVFGDAKTGVDMIVLKTCQDLGYAYKKFDADWDKHGKPAGHIRNGEMVRYCMDSGEDVVCYGIRAEGLSNGTDNC